MKTNYIYYIIIFVLAAGIYCNTWNAGFTFDDQTIVEHNLLINKISSIRDLFKPVKEISPEYQRRDSTRGSEIHHSIWKEIFITDYWNKPELLKFYRPVTVFSYALNYALFGKKPVVYHTTLFKSGIKDPEKFSGAHFHILNSLFHGFACIGVFYLLLTGMRFYSAFLGALIYAIHPIHTEAVASIVGRAEILSQVFFVFSLIIFLKEWKPVRIWFPVSMITLFAAFLSKETSVTYILVILLFTYFAKYRVHEDAVIDDKTISDFFKSILSGKNGMGYSRLFIAGSLVLTVIFLLLRGYVLQQVEPSYRQDRISFLESMTAGGTHIDMVDNPLISQGIVQRKLMAFSILGDYLWQGIYPMASLSPDYSYRQIKPVKNTKEIVLLFRSVVLHGLLILLLVFFWRKKETAVSWILFYFITISLISNMILFIGTIKAERLLYLSSLGIAALLGYGIHNGLKKIQPGSKILYNSVLCIAVLYIAGFGARTFWRNFDWYSQRTLFEKAVITSPDSYKTHYNLAKELNDNSERIRLGLQGALQNKLDGQSPWTVSENLYVSRMIHAFILETRKEPNPFPMEQSIRYFLSARDPQEKNRAYNDIVTNVNFISSKLLDRALYHVQKSEKIYDQSPEVFNLHGNILAQRSAMGLGEADESLSLYQKVIELNLLKCIEKLMNTGKPVDALLPEYAGIIQELTDGTISIKDMITRNKLFQSLSDKEQQKLIENLPPGPGMNKGGQLNTYILQSPSLRSSMADAYCNMGFSCRETAHRIYNDATKQLRSAGENLNQNKITGTQYDTVKLQFEGNKNTYNKLLVRGLKYVLTGLSYRHDHKELLNLAAVLSCETGKYDEGLEYFYVLFNQDISEDNLKNVRDTLANMLLAASDRETLIQAARYIFQFNEILSKKLNALNRFDPHQKMKSNMIISAQKELMPYLYRFCLERKEFGKAVFLIKADISTENMQALQMLGMILVQLKKELRSPETIEMAFDAIKPDIPFHAETVDRTISIILNKITHRAESSGDYESAARICYEDGKYQQAREIIQQALKKFPDNNELRKILEIIGKQTD